MAAIVKRGESWYCQVRRKGITKCKTFKTYEDAKSWSDSLEKDIEHGVYRFKQINLTLREIKRMFTRTQDRAKKYKMDHELTLDSILRLWELSNGICALSGLPFSSVKPEGCRRRPFYPSVDRIDSKIGYLEGNIRLVCVIANIARSDFDDGSLIYLAKGIVNNSK